MRKRGGGGKDELGDLPGEDEDGDEPEPMGSSLVPRLGERVAKPGERMPELGNGLTGVRLFNREPGIIERPNTGFGLGSADAGLDLEPDAGEEFACTDGDLVDIDAER